MKIMRVKLCKTAEKYISFILHNMGRSSLSSGQSRKMKKYRNVVKRYITFSEKKKRIYPSSSSDYNSRIYTENILLKMNTYK
jgi:hypothetical protein